MTSSMTWFGWSAVGVFAFLFVMNFVWAVVCNKRGRAIKGYKTAVTNAVEEADESSAKVLELEETVKNKDARIEKIVAGRKEDQNRVSAGIETIAGLNEKLDAKEDLIDQLEKANNKRQKQIEKLESRHTLKSGVKFLCKKNKNGRYYGVIQPSDNGRLFTSSDLRATDAKTIETALKKVCDTIPITKE